MRLTLLVTVMVTELLSPMNELSVVWQFVAENIISLRLLQPDNIPVPMVAMFSDIRIVSISELANTPSAMPVTSKSSPTTTVPVLYGDVVNLRR